MIDTQPRRRLNAANAFSDNSAPATRLDALPHDLLAEIGERSGPRTTVRLMCATRDLRGALEAPSVWRNFYRRHIDAKADLPGDAWLPRFAEGARAEACLDRALAGCLGGLRDLVQSPSQRLAVVSFPGDGNWEKAARAYLETAAREVERPFVQLSLCSEPFSSQLQRASEARAVCVVTHVEAACPFHLRKLVGHLDDHPQSPLTLVAFHGETADTLDGALERRTTPATRFACDIDVPTLRIDPA